MGFMSKATRDKLRGLHLADKVKSRVTGPTKDATGEPNRQSPRRSFGGRPAGGNIDMNRRSARSGIAGGLRRRSFGGRPTGGNIDMNRRSARSGTAGGRPTGGNIDTNRLMARSGRAGGRARMFSEGGEAKKTGSTARGCGMAKPSKFKIY